MVGIILTRKNLRFVHAFKGEDKIYDHELDGAPWEEAIIMAAMQKAREHLGFTLRDDFRLLVDLPYSHAVIQSVPFPQGQLAQVLENYLEEELPYDIEDFKFDFQVLETKGQQSCVLGFWIRADILSSWCHYADEYSLNSLDIQPCEAALLPSFKSNESILKMSPDRDGKIRYCGIQIQEGLPLLLLGSMKATEDPEQVSNMLRFQGSNWANFNALELTESLKPLAPCAKQLGIPDTKIVPDSTFGDPFCEYALGRNSARLLFNYRKGEFAQKGLEERVLMPVAILILSLTTLVGVLAWKNYQLAKVETSNLTILTRQKEKIWDHLFEGQKAPSSRMEQQMEALYKKMTGGEEGPGESENISSLQSLGFLFTYIKPDDEVLIERASIGKSITLSGMSKEQPRIYKLGEGFKNQDQFREPNITADDKIIKNEAGQEETLYSFRLSTSLLKQDAK